MKKITAKVITISSQLLIVGLFLLSLFVGKGSNDKLLTISNNNFEKMAETTSSLFKQEEMMFTQLDDSVVVVLEDNTEKDILEEEKDEVKQEETKEEIKKENNVVVEETKQEETNTSNLEATVLETHVGNLTGYGADCYGCSGITSSGFDLRETMYYEDPEYGTVRILAADPMFSFYSIFRINVPGMEPFIGIVLDRGGNVGYGKGTLFDLAYISENDPNLIGLTRNVTFELLRSGK